MDNVKASRENNTKGCTSWNKRTLLEKYLILMCLALFLGLTSLIGLHIFYRYAHRVPARRICNSPSCEREAGRILKNMDSSVNPCSDFYEFACGSFVKYERYTEERVHGLLDGVEYILRYSKDSIEEADENTGPSFVKKLKKFYNSCLTRPTDTSEIIMELLNRTNLGSFPIYDEISGESRTLEEVLAITTTFIGEGDNSLFSIYNLKNNVTISKGRSFVDWNRFMDTTEDEARERKEKYTHLLMLTQFYSTKPSYNLGDEAYDIVDFQEALANVTSNRYDESKAFVTVSELEDICPEIKWEDFLQLLYGNSGRFDEADTLGETNIILYDIGYVKDICNLIKIWGSGIVQNFLVWNFLTYALTDFDPSFYKSLREMDPDNYRLHTTKYFPINWKYCVQAVGNDPLFSAGLDYLVIERMNPDRILDEVQEYTKNILKVMDRMFAKEDWLDDHSRTVLRKELDDFSTYIGYTEESRDINLVEKQLKNIIVSDNYIENWLQIRKQACPADWCKDDIPVRDTRPYRPLIFGSYGGGGQMEIPLGTLVPPVFTPDVPKYLNYGTIGFLIAHEISHTFDHSVYLEWLNVSDGAIAMFEKKSECYEKQYSSLPLDKHGAMVDVMKTSRDNIADNTGIIQAFSAYKEYIEGKEEEEHLPGLEYTNFQLFFIKFAQMWCEVMESPAKIYKHDSHSPGKYRVRETLKNFPSFSQEFNCPSGSLMNPWHKCRLWG